MYMVHLLDGLQVTPVSVILSTVLSVLLEIRCVPITAISTLPLVGVADNVTVKESAVDVARAGP